MGMRWGEHIAEPRRREPAPAVTRTAAATIQRQSRLRGISEHPGAALTRRCRAARLGRCPTSGSTSPREGPSRRRTWTRRCEHSTESARPARSHASCRQRSRSSSSAGLPASTSRSRCTARARQAQSLAPASTHPQVRPSGGCNSHLQLPATHAHFHGKRGPGSAAQSHDAGRTTTSHVAPALHDPLGSPVG